MKLLSILLAAAAAISAQTYTATSLNPSNSRYEVANVLGLNNHGQVLVDLCTNGICVGADRTVGIWANGVITPLPVPDGYSYYAQPEWYAINDSGTVVGTLLVTGASSQVGHVFIWKDGVATILPDAPYSAEFSGEGCPSSANGQSASYGINAAAHILGSTAYSPPQSGLECSATWIYDGSSFRILPVPVPAKCSGPAPLPNGGITSSPQFNDADQVVISVENNICGAAYTEQDPVVIQPNGSYSFLPLGSLSGAAAGGINDVGQVLGYYGSPTAGLTFWDGGGVQNLGSGGYAHLNQAGHVLYYSPPLAQEGSMYIWKNGAATAVDVPSPVPQNLEPVAFNDAGQIAAGGVGSAAYLLTPSGACAEDVTSKVSITRTGFRYNHSTGFFELIGSVTNTSDAPIPGPISIVVDDLPASATLVDIAGATLCNAPQGSPYVNDSQFGAGQFLEPGGSFTGSLSFIDTAQTGFSYSLRVLAGTGNR